MTDCGCPSSSGLIDRNPDDFIALNRSSLAALGGQEGYWRCSDFLGQVMRLAEVLPARQYAINLCENRYLFMLGFCAAIVKQQTNLLPQNRAEATQRNLLDQYANSYILHDGVASIVHDARHFDINYVNLLGEPARDIPQILPEFDLFLFTSNNEPTGGVLLEAYACRVPVVAANAGGIPEVVMDKETGLLAAIATMK
ncbi:MAG: glycosyltransferase, partial [Sphingobacteriales bacterium]